jgi:protein-disulfide isomerase
MTRRQNLTANWPWLLLALFAPGQLTAQSSDDLIAIRRDIDALLRGQEAIQKALGEMSANTSGRRLPIAGGSILLDIEGAPSQGLHTAPVTIVEFTDYQCPFCARHATQVLPSIVSDYVKTGKVRYVVRDFPLQSHSNAPKAAEAAYCAGDQNKYWEMHDLIFADQQNLGISDLWSRAGSLGLNQLAFADCLASGKYAKQVARNLANAQAAGVESVPTFYLALTNQEGKMLKTATKLVGALPYSSFKAALDILLPTNQNQLMPLH